MAWIYLVLAGIFEIFWATMMKLSNGFTRINFSVYTILGMILSFWLLSRSLKELPMSLAYPIWTGIGAVGAVLVGFIFFHDDIHFTTWLFICLLLVSIIGIKVTSGH